LAPKVVVLRAGPAFPYELVQSFEKRETPFEGGDDPIFSSKIKKRRLPATQAVPKVRSEAEMFHTSGHIRVAIEHPENEDALFVGLD
jgi:hypothetical protein